MHAMKMSDCGCFVVYIVDDENVGKCKVHVCSEHSEAPELQAKLFELASALEELVGLRKV